jgi:hypothetical protein
MAVRTVNSPVQPYPSWRVRLLQSESGEMQPTSIIYIGAFDVEIRDPRCRFSGLRGNRSCCRPPTASAGRRRASAASSISGNPMRLAALPPVTLSVGRIFPIHRASFFDPEDSGQCAPLFLQRSILARLFWLRSSPPARKRSPSFDLYQTRQARYAEVVTPDVLLCRLANRRS